MGSGIGTAFAAWIMNSLAIFPTSHKLPPVWTVLAGRYLGASRALCTRRHSTALLS